MHVHVAAKYYSCCVMFPPWINKSHLCELNALITMQVFILINLFVYVIVGSSTIFFFLYIFVLSAMYE